VELKKEHSEQKRTEKRIKRISYDDPDSHAGEIKHEKENKTWILVL
jgi:hypothetical protein